VSWIIVSQCDAQCVFCSLMPIAMCYVIFSSSLGNDLINWNSGLSVPSVRMSVHLFTKSFSDFDLIWCVGRPRPDMCTIMTSTQSTVKIKVTEFLKLKKLHFSWSISSPPLFWSVAQDWWLIVIIWDLLYRLSEPDFWISFSISYHDFKLRRMSILQDFQRAIFPYCLRLESHGRLCW